jgi:hypothetical protein
LKIPGTGQGTLTGAVIRQMKNVRFKSEKVGFFQQYEVQAAAGLVYIGLEVADPSMAGTTQRPDFVGQERPFEGGCALVHGTTHRGTVS